MENCICSVREGEERLISQGAYVDLYISREYGEYHIVALSDGRASTRIYYCPECGRKLDER
jgi:hypothetical protein